MNKKEIAYFSTPLNFAVESMKHEVRLKRNSDKNDMIPGGKKYKVVFSYQPLTAGVHKVYLAGDFNDFSTSSLKMNDHNGIYQISLDLVPGKYNYKFLVDGIWQTDLNAEEFSADGFGGQNSVIFVGDRDQIEALRKVEIIYRSDVNGEDVFIAGTFNDWNAGVDRFRKISDNLFKMDLILKQGTYQFKIKDGIIWKNHPELPRGKDDGFSGFNSLLEVDFSYPRIQEIEDKTDIHTFGLYTEEALNYLDPLTDNKIAFSSLSYKENVDSISLLIESQEWIMKKYHSNGEFDFYRLILDLSNFPKEMVFLFKYSKNDSVIYLGGNGFREKMDLTEPFRIDSSRINELKTPDWVKKGVFYQIFLDRFYNGDATLNPDFSEWYYHDKNLPGQKTERFHYVPDWYDTQDLRSDPKHPMRKAEIRSFYGGDLPGLIKKLNYLSDLGITIIYLNPIFPARSNHKYDAADFMSIDPHFGNLEQFKHFINLAHGIGIKVILDVAFNHTGETFWAFQDSLKNGPDSKYYPWYEWKKWPLPSKKFNPTEYYSCWWGFAHMPELDFDRSRLSPYENNIKDISSAEPNWDVVNYLLEVTRFWLIDQDIDGFRLDVPNEVPFWFWKLFREKVKSLKPEAYIVGEIWHDASTWVNENYFDAVMNYQFFKEPTIKFFNLRITDSRQFDREINKGLCTYHTQKSQAMMNLIGSHDTFRYLEIARGDIARLKLTVLFQMTFVGAPHIWYGDEIGMMGSHDPDCRRPFNWRYTEDPAMVDLRTFYRDLIRIRKENEVLSLGSYETLIARDKIYFYLRVYNNDKILVAINNEEKPLNFFEQITGINGSWQELITGKIYCLDPGSISLVIEPFSGLILKKMNDPDSP